MTSKIDVIVADIDARIAKCWVAAEMFLANRDAHGVMDMGCELAALIRSKLELLKLKE